MNPDVGLEELASTPPTPENIDHVPVPTVGVLAASVVLVWPHKVWLTPAFEVDGFLGKLIDTSSVEGVQVELVMVHLKT